MPVLMQLLQLIGASGKESQTASVPVSEAGTLIDSAADKKGAFASAKADPGSGANFVENLTSILSRPESPSNIPVPSVGSFKKFDIFGRR
jgi:hypothetical protein